MYTIYTLYFNNTPIIDCLTLNSVKKQIRNGLYVGYKKNYTKEDIENNVWYKEDIDEFVRNFPETNIFTFKVNKSKYVSKFMENEKIYTEYCPLLQNREEKIKNIYEDN